MRIKPKPPPKSMPDGFPQYGASAKQGTRGVAIVSRIVDEGFGWLFKRNHQEHDFGIDGQIEVVTKAGSVTGQMLACQIKCGPSFFGETNRWGYVYRGETKHFNYLANYPVPVLIVICDPKTQECIWERFHATDVQVTEGGWKMTIPFDNKLSCSKSELEAMLPPVTDQLSPLREYWKVNNIFFRYEVILFMVDRPEVEAMDASRARGFRSRLCASKDLMMHCQGKIDIIFHGYNDEPRELFEIEEVRKYVALLSEAIPELFFFSRTEEPATTLTLFVFCLGGVGWEAERSTPGNPQKVVVDYDALEPFFNYHFTRLNWICEFLELSVEEIRAIGDAAIKAMNCAARVNRIV
jgi:hypothetical protein